MPYLYQAQTFESLPHVEVHRKLIFPAARFDSVDDIGVFAGARVVLFIGKKTKTLVGVFIDHVLHPTGKII